MFNKANTNEYIYIYNYICLNLLHITSINQLQSQSIVWCQSMITWISIVVQSITWHNQVILYSYLLPQLVTSKTMSIYNIDMKQIVFQKEMSKGEGQANLRWGLHTQLTSKEGMTDWTERITDIFTSWSQPEVSKTCVDSPRSCRKFVWDFQPESSEWQELSFGWNKHNFFIPYGCKRA